MLMRAFSGLRFKRSIMLVRYTLAKSTTRTLMKYRHWAPTILDGQALFVAGLETLAH